MTETEAKPAVCTAIKPHSIWPWRCQLKAGHDPADAHRWPLESEHYNYPIDQYDHAWLVSELRLQLTNMEHLKRDHREANGRAERTLAALLSGLVDLAPGNSTRKTLLVADVQALWQKALGRG